MLSQALPHLCTYHLDASNDLCEPEISERQYNARRFRTVDVQDLFEDSRRAPVSRLAPGYTVYRRPRMDEEGVPANAELV